MDHQEGTELKATFNRKRLLDAFSVAASVTPTRSPKPILQNVKMVVSGSEAELIGTDMEIGIRKTVECVQVERDGTAILPTDRFSSILRTSSDETIDVEADDEKKILVKTRSGRFTLNGEDPALFPDVPAFDAEAYVVLLDTDLGQMIRRTSYATDIDSARYALGGALIEFDEASVAFVATDGRRLARAVYPAEYVGARQDYGQPVAPVKALKLIDRTLPANGSQVHLAIQTGRAVMIRTEDATIYARLVEGRYPRYQEVIPKAVGHRVTLKAGLFKAAVEQAAVCLDQTSKGVLMTFGEDHVELSATTADVGESRVVLPYPDAVPGLGMKVSLDASYTLDLLKSVDPDTDIVVGLSGPEIPVEFRDGDRLTAVIMPLSQNR